MPRIDRSNFVVCDYQPRRANPEKFIIVDQDKESTVKQ
jgi:hypothetical protein